MWKGKRLGKLVFDWMGLLFVAAVVVLALTGAWKAPAGGDVATGAAVPANTDEGALLIVLDAGHGGPDGGASSPNGVKEAGINLQVAKLVEKGLREAGFAVEMTRKTADALAKNKRDDMEARRASMRQDGVAAVVSIHMNKFRDSSIHGPMAFYMQGSEEGAKLATAIIETVCESIENPRRAANPGDYYVLRESIAPAVIVECGFLSNANDEALLQDEKHQRALADGIVAGIVRYFGK